MSFNIESSKNNAAFVSGIKFSSNYDSQYIKTVMLELFTQFTTIKNIQIININNTSLEEGENPDNETLKQYSCIIIFHNTEDLNHLIKIWGDIKNFVKINGFPIAVRKYMDKNYNSNNEKFISYALVAVYNIVDTLKIDDYKAPNKDMMNYIDEQVFHSRFSKFAVFIQNKAGVEDVNPQLQFLKIDDKTYKPFITIQFNNFFNADNFISSYNKIILFDNKNLELDYAYKDSSDKSIGKYGDSLQRSLEGEIASA